MLCTLPVVAQNDNTDVIRLQVEGHTLNAGVEFNHLSCLDLSQTEHTGNTVTDRNDGTELFQVILHKIELDSPVIANWKVARRPVRG